MYCKKSQATKVNTKFIVIVYSNLSGYVLFKAFLRHGLPSTQEKLLALMNKVCQSRKHWTSLWKRKQVTKARTKSLKKTSSTTRLYISKKKKITKSLFIIFWVKIQSRIFVAYPLCHNHILCFTIYQKPKFLIYLY